MPEEWEEKRGLEVWIVVALGVYALGVYALGWYWALCPLDAVLFAFMLCFVTPLYALIGTVVYKTCRGGG